ncbi:hypothetical protein JJB75_09595 [Clostridium perfringens]|uniref:hypothetical protein n=1 Tax=Clostridium perfringens TaxID=1502 RepID=UPI000D7198BF|nr:hypothetical protein [Clostridium perfringens]KAB8119294.1 hypothetical protein FVB38_12420 [Clostridium perfringens]MBO3303533.1 hypothetical protein [Clostridium perfringens]MBO3306989.1 hypothetical protein [Clostridium perfringens]MBO3310233.1 hypothetical protein [Clostridium perfringens]MBO3316392.1 hypothetical protein [Clostridium perfringens]
MNHYYFNNNTDDKGRHEVHTENCSWGPSPLNRTYIGYYSNCKEAIRAAQNLNPFKSFDGCYWCCRECHKG